MFTSAPAAKCCLMASMFPVSAAWVIEMSGTLVIGGSGALAVGGPGCVASATGLAGSTSAGGVDCFGCTSATGLVGSASAGGDGGGVSAIVTVSEGGISGGEDC